MHAFRSVIGVLALALGVYLIIVNSLFIGAVALLFGGFMSVTGFTTPSGRQISGKNKQPCLRQLKGKRH